MEKVALIELDTYLADLARQPTDRSFVTPDSIEWEGSDFSKEILCTTTEEAIAQRIGANVLKIDDQLITLPPHEIRVLNTLIVNRHRQLQAPHIQEITHKSKSLTHRALTGLMRKLGSQDPPLIQQIEAQRDNSTQATRAYQLAPEFQIEESADSLPDANRAKLLGRVLAIYQDSTGLHEHMDPQNRQAYFAYGTMPRNIMARTYARLSSDDFYPLFRTIDSAMEQYQDNDDPWLPEVQEAVLAWNAIYYSALGLMRYEVHAFEQRTLLFGVGEDLRQATATELWRATMHYDAEKSSFPYYARRCIKSYPTH